MQYVTRCRRVRNIFTRTLIHRVLCLFVITLCGCSTKIKLLQKSDTVAPSVVMSLNWVGVSPISTTSVTVSWVKSTSSNLENQKIQFYSDAFCIAPSGAIIDLSSSTVQSYAWTAPGAGTYTYRLTSLNSSQVESISPCSSSLVIDLAAPSVPSGLALNTPASSPGGNATPIVQVSGVTSGDTIGLYSDSGCTVSKGSGTASGATINITSSALAAGAYTFYAKATDPAGNASSCSVASVAYTYVVLAPATSLAWIENSPAPSTVINAAWDLSTSAISDQKIQFYTGATCAVVSGALVDLTSSTLRNYSFTGTAGSTYSFKVTVVDSGGSTTDSACSGGMAISSGLALSPLYLRYPIGAAMSETFSGSSGSGAGYTYSKTSGPGAIDGTTGLFTSAVGTRTVGTTTQLQVMDSAAATATATLMHGRFAVNGPVYATVTDGTSLYVGGNFSAVNPEPAVGLVAVNPTTGVSLSRTLASSFNGEIYSMQALGNTAFIGGSFTTYQGVPVQNLVKIDLITGKLDTTFTQSTGTNGRVYALALSGSSLYAGGTFSTYRGNNKGYFIAKIDATTGVMDTTNFNTAASTGPAGGVITLALNPSGSALYVGGGFTSYRGNVNGRYLAKVNASTGVMDAANFNTAGGPAAIVYSLVLSGSSLYVGGAFTSYRADTNGRYLAKVNATTGVMDTANFNTAAGPDYTVEALALSGSSLYLGGEFASYRGNNKGFHLAKVDATTGVMDTANFNTAASTGPYGIVNSLAVIGSSLYVGGDFPLYRLDAKGAYLAKVDATTGVMDTAGFNTATGVGPKNSVTLLAPFGTSLYVGGTFSTYGITGTPVQNLAKIDIATGALDTTFTQSTGPNLPVYALVLSGTSLYVGGEFDTYRGDDKGFRVAKIHKTSGVLDTGGFNSSSGAGPDGGVKALAISGAALYVGGDFPSYRGNGTVQYLAKVDTTTGAADTAAFNSTPGPDAPVDALAVSSNGFSIFVGGRFSSYQSDARGQFLAKVDTTTGVFDVGGFNTSAGPSGDVTALALSSDGLFLYVGGTFSDYKGNGAGAIVAKVDTTLGALDDLNFNATASGAYSVKALALSADDSTLYVGGVTPDAVSSSLKKLDASTGTLDATFEANSDLRNPSTQIYGLALSGTSVFVGGNFKIFGENSCGPLIFVDVTSGLEQ